MNAGEGNEGRVRKIFVLCCGGLYVFAVYFWHILEAVPEEAAGAKMPG